MPFRRGLDGPAAGGPPLHPARTVFTGFAAAALIGTALLLLPVSRSGEADVDLIESLFTAVSALCVTGLIITDTPVHWSPFGHVVILALIQIGGLGVMTFASIVGLAVVRRFRLRSKITTAAEAKAVGLADIRPLIVGILKIALLIEVVAAVILTWRFATTYAEPLHEAAWLGVFHSVSAFNNAGFALFSDSVMSFVDDPVICLTLAVATILGGLGFPVLMQLRRHLREPILWSMNTRIVVWGTVVLLVVGTIFITAVEWHNPRTLGALDWPARLLAGFFQSVQTRTAGFNSVDIAELQSSTLLGMDVLMFIGGGPAGTAGGIKLTTFAVLFFIIVTEIRGDAAVNVFGKRLARSVHRQAIAVALLAMALVVSSAGLLMLLTDFTLDQILFEVISAFGTVGLSTGITAQLPVTAQLILVVLMFIGRLGPITFASALALRERHLLYELPKERPIIG